MRRRVVATLPKNMAGRELKLGPGGLRDIEFAVQLLQLVHGSADDRLRVPATLPALAALADGGYVGRADADDLAQAYRFLRQTEHLLQIYQLRRTHTLPTDPAVLRRLGRAMRKSNAANPVFPNGPLVPPHHRALPPGPVRARPRGFLPAAARPGPPARPRVAPGRPRPEEAFTQAWTRHAQQVRRLHEKLFYRPLLDAVAKLPSGAARLTPDAARARLEALGYRDPAGALRHIEALTSGLRRRAAIQRTLLPVLLGWFADAAEPDAGLLAFRQVSEALGETPWFLRLLRDETKAAERIATVLASSRYATGLLLRAPEAVAIFADDAELVPKTADALRAEMMAAARRHAATLVPSPRSPATAESAGRHESGTTTAAASRQRGRRRAGGGHHPLAPPPRAAAGRGGGRARPDRAGRDGRGAHRDHDRDPRRRPRGRDREDRDGAARPAADQVRGDRDGPVRRPRVRLRQRRRRDLRARPDPTPGGGRRRPSARRPTRPRRSAPSCAGCSRSPRPTRRCWSTRTCAPRAGRARWSAAWPRAGRTTSGGPRHGSSRRCCGPSSRSAARNWARSSSRWPTGSGTRPAGSAIPPCAKSAGSRRASRRSESRAAPTGRCTSSSARAACPTWSGRCSCSSSGTATPSRGCAPPAPWPRSPRRCEAGLVTAPDEAALSAAWRFGSRVRNAIMLVRGRPGDAFPTKHDELTAVARLLGYKPSPAGGRRRRPFLQLRRRLERHPRPGPRGGLPPHRPPRPQGHGPPLLRLTPSPRPHPPRPRPDHPAPARPTARHPRCPRPARPTTRLRKPSISTRAPH